MKKKLTQEKLKKLLDYDKKTGIFTWKRNMRGPVKCGDEAKSKHSCGYLTTTIEQKQYYLHRLAWLYVKGYFPEYEIDHINRLRDDNRFINLREISHQCNIRNSKTPSNNSSGIVGVWWDKTRNKWGAGINPGTGKISLGRFKEKKDAATCRWEAEKKYNFQNCNSTSSAYIFLKKEGVL